jgi:immune inhibitor A
LSKGDVDSEPVADFLMNPLLEKQLALKEVALQAKLEGRTEGKVYEVSKDLYVELEREGEDLIWTTLGEFADFPNNNIPEPDRAVDNTTYWVDDFNREHFMDMLFDEGPGVNSMRMFYIEQSSGRYAVDGDVTDWVAVSGNQADYAYPDFALTWNFVDESVDAWYADSLSSMTPDEINAYLSQFDVWDRYDWDGDGNFDEPDGYIDHYQAIHAGEGAEAGAPNAIWSHRWYVQLTCIGCGGPTVGGTVNPSGGTQIGDSDYWIGDYTTEPENGAVGVFSHEFGHDLGLPDLYNTGSGPENSTAFWWIMSSGSWGSQNPENIGTAPHHFSIWSKFQLGWLNYDVASAGSTSRHILGPSEYNTHFAQGLFVLLPDKEVTDVIADPYEGDYFYYSDSGNDLDNVMYKAFTLPAGASLMAKANVQIEVDWDYAYLVVSTDGGATWENVETNLSTDSDPNGQNFGHGITGDSGGWVDLTADLSAYEGDVMLGFRYWTDGAAVEPGFMVDNLEITDYPLDGAEEEDAGWTFDGFRRSTGTETASYFNAYAVANKVFTGYDAGLNNPYNFGFLDNPDLGNWVERFPYQEGMLISYWDTSESDNNTASHWGSGLILPIDAHPEVMYRADGGVWRNRIQSYDSTFSHNPTDELTLHWLSQPSTHASQPGVYLFDDRNSYWSADNPTGSAIVPNTGTQIWLMGTHPNGLLMKVQVQPAVEVTK